MAEKTLRYALLAGWSTSRRLATAPYWAQTGLIAGYAVLLHVLYWRSREADSSGSEAPSPVSS